MHHGTHWTSSLTYERAHRGWGTVQSDHPVDNFTIHSHWLNINYSAHLEIVFFFPLERGSSTPCFPSLPSFVPCSRERREDKSLFLSYHE